MFLKYPINAYIVRDESFESLDDHLRGRLASAVRKNKTKEVKELTAVIGHPLDLCLLTSTFITLNTSANNGSHLCCLPLSSSCVPMVGVTMDCQLAMRILKN